MKDDIFVLTSDVCCFTTQLMQLFLVIEGYLWWKMNVERANALESLDTRHTYRPGIVRTNGKASHAAASASHDRVRIIR